MKGNPCSDMLLWRAFGIRPVVETINGTTSTLLTLLILILPRLLPQMFTATLI